MTLREARLARGLSQAEVARWACLKDRSVVSRVENGDTNPDIQTLAAILDALGANLDVLETRQAKMVCVTLDRRQHRMKRDLKNPPLPEPYLGPPLPY